MVNDIQLHVFNGLNCTPGSTVQGELKVSVVDKPKKYNSIVVTLKGGANVYWSESSGTGDNRTTASYRNAETYINLELTVWKVENSPTGDLPIGEYSFPFSFQLPQNLPASFEGVCGQIRYEVEGKIMQSGRVNTFSLHRVVTRLIIEDRTPGTEILRVCSEPASVDKSKKVDFLCFISGSVSATAKVPQTGFSPGETIPITVDVGNETSKPIRVAANLHRHETVTSRGGRRHSSFRRIARTLSSPINSGVITAYQDENMKIPTDARTMRNHPFISAEYILDVKVIIPWSLNMDLKIPIVIANPPVMGEGAPFISQPGYPAPQQPGYPAPQKPGYPAPQQPGYPAPQQPGYPAPQKPGYPAPQQPGYPAPQQPGYPAPQKPGYPAPQQPGYPAPQQPGYPAPQQPGYPAPQQPGYPAPQQPGYPAPQQPGYPAPQQPGYPAPQSIGFRLDHLVSAMFKRSS